MALKRKTSKPQATGKSKLDPEILAELEKIGSWELLPKSEVLGIKKINGTYYINAEKKKAPVTRLAEVRPVPASHFKWELIQARIKHDEESGPIRSNFLEGFTVKFRGTWYECTGQWFHIYESTKPELVSAAANAFFVSREHFDTLQETYSGDTLSDNNSVRGIAEIGGRSFVCVAKSSEWLKAYEVKPGPVGKKIPIAAGRAYTGDFAFRNKIWHFAWNELKFICDDGSGTNVVVGVTIEAKAKPKPKIVWHDNPLRPNALVERLTKPKPEFDRGQVLADSVRSKKINSWAIAAEIMSVKSKQSVTFHLEAWHGSNDYSLNPNEKVAFEFDGDKGQVKAAKIARQLNAANALHFEVVPHP